MPSASIREVSAHFPARGMLFADRNECGCRLTRGCRLTPRLTQESGIANGHEESEEEDDGGEGVDKQRNRGEAVLFNPKHCDHKTQNNVSWARNRMQVRMTDVSSTCCRGHAQIVHKHGECVPDG